MISVTRKGSGLSRLASRLAPVAQAQVDEASERVAAGARAIVPVRTGRLKASLQSEPAGVLSAVTRTDVPYAAAVELGTAKRPAKPYLRPAAFTEAARFPVEVAKALRLAIKS